MANDRPQRPKLKRRSSRAAKDKLNDEADLKVITKYPKQKCAVPGCGFNAVGSVDICKKHGGDPVVESNLIAADEMTDVMIASGYDPAVHPMQYLELARQGASEVEIAASLGVSVRIMRQWGEKYLDFNTAVEIGNALHEAWWLGEGKKNLDNRGYNTGLYKFITGNKLGYSDKVESKNMHVHAGVLMVPTPMTSDEWEKQVEKN